MAIRIKKKKKSLNQNRIGNNQLNHFRERLERVDWGPKLNVALQMNESGAEEKMSAVILDFVEPFKDMMRGPEEYRRLIALAVAAWNVAITRQLKKPDVPDVLDELFPAGSDQEEFHKISRMLVELLVKYKLENERFAKNTRLVVSYQLSETRSGLHFSVASVPAA